MTPEEVAADLTKVEALIEFAEEAIPNMRRYWSRWGGPESIGADLRAWPWPSVGTCRHTWDSVPC